MKEFWNMIQMVFTMLGGWLGYFLGGCDGLLFALVVFVVMDYITGFFGVPDPNAVPCLPLRSAPLLVQATSYFAASLSIFSLSSRFRDG